MSQLRILTRRQFLEIGGQALIAAAMAASPSNLLAGMNAGATVRWRGFNLVEKAKPNRNLPYSESDFETIREWGFNFVRIPVDYHNFTASPGQYREDTLREIDQAVGFGRNYGVHVNLAFEAAPGFCHCNTEPETLWMDTADGHAALAEFVAQWRMFAERFRGSSPEQLSFNLVGEPHNIVASAYVPIIRALFSAIKAVDPSRPIMIDGLQWATEPVPELLDLKATQCTRGYLPHELTRFGAQWAAGAESLKVPTWPLVENGMRWDKDRLRKQTIEPWVDQIQRRGGAVFVGEWGVLSHTPESVTLSYMRDQLSLWREVGWGWALWQLRGAFGVLDSGRKDVQYEEFKGHHLHRRMLELLREG